MIEIRFQNILLTNIIDFKSFKHFIIIFDPK